MLIKLQQNFPILLLFILLGFFSYISWTNKMFADGSDEIAHYFISKYSVSHPGLLLDLWGKPIFTILSAPFSQFGYIGLKIFNVIIGILTGYVTYIISKKTHNQNSWLSIVFLLFTPIYFVVMQSGLTEILFSFVVATTVSLFLSKKFVLSAIVISIIPLVRNEGFIFFPLIVMSLIFVKQYRIIPLVFSGMIIFGLLSHFFKQDFFYFFNSSPYPLEAYSVYGKGSLEHFFINKNYLFGPIVEMFFWVGVVASFVDIKNNNGKKRITKIIELLLIVGIFFTYIFAHSLVWWLGIGRSLGMLRVVAGGGP
ncbi:MAG TPA: hypothetical protein DEP87_03980, partial [Candidatus Pacebacteria bacterium]|nr:hypothetical protein [Candidatus Paceibacterota bacterium]